MNLNGLVIEKTCMNKELFPLSATVPTIIMPVGTKLKAEYTQCNFVKYSDQIESARGNSCVKA